MNTNQMGTLMDSTRLEEISTAISAATRQLVNDIPELDGVVVVPLWTKAAGIVDAGPYWTILRSGHSPLASLRVAAHMQAIVLDQARHAQTDIAILASHGSDILRTLIQEASEVLDTNDAETETETPENLHIAGDTGPDCSP